MQKLLVAASLAALLASSAAYADVGASVDAGSSGLGLHLIVPVQSGLNLRVGPNVLNYSYNTTENQIDYDAKLKLQTVDALLDWYPADGSFRITAGAAYNNSHVDVVAKPNGSSYTINGHTYDASHVGTINGNIDFRKAAPYIGIGWGNAADKEKGFGFATDFGVLLMGTPNTSLANQNCTDIQQVCSQIASDVAVENAKLKDAADRFKAYPIVRVSATYRF